MRDYDIKSDLKQEQFQTLKLVQGDRGNKIKINVFEEGQPVNLAGCSITAKYKRADGEVVNDGIIEQEFSSDENFNINYFYAVMNSDITKVSGTLKMIFTIEKDDVKVSTFLLLADVREGIGENTGSSGGSTGGGEVTVDLNDYQKKTDNGLETNNKTIIGAINEVNTQCKDIANTKVDKVDGKGLSTNDFTNAEKNKLANLSETGFTDEQISNALQSKIDDGSLGALSIENGSITYDKFSYDLKNKKGININRVSSLWSINNQFYASIKNKSNYQASNSNGINVIDCIVKPGLKYYVFGDISPTQVAGVNHYYGLIMDKNRKELSLIEANVSDNSFTIPNLELEAVFLGFNSTTVKDEIVVSEIKVDNYTNYPALTYNEKDFTYKDDSLSKSILDDSVVYKEDEIKGIVCKNNIYKDKERIITDLGALYIPYREYSNITGKTLNISNDGYIEIENSFLDSDYNIPIKDGIIEIDMNVRTLNSDTYKTNIICTDMTRDNTSDVYFSLQLKGGTDFLGYEINAGKNSSGRFTNVLTKDEKYLYFNGVVTIDLNNKTISAKSRDRLYEPASYTFQVENTEIHTVKKFCLGARWANKGRPVSTTADHNGQSVYLGIQHLKFNGQSIGYISNLKDKNNKNVELNTDNIANIKRGKNLTEILDDIDSYNLISQCVKEMKNFYNRDLKNYKGEFDINYLDKIRENSINGDFYLYKGERIILDNFFIYDNSMIYYKDGYFKSIKIPEKNNIISPIIKYDVCILGGGAGGIGSAYALKDSGLNVVLIEKLDKLGGTHCNAGVTELLSSPVGNWYKEICKEAYESNNMSFFTKEYSYGNNSETEFDKLFRGSYYTHSKSKWGNKISINENWFSNKYYADLKDTIDIRFNTEFISSLENDKTMYGITVRNKLTGQVYTIYADYFIDCSGDGILCKYGKQLDVDYFIGADAKTLYDESSITEGFEGNHYEINTLEPTYYVLNKNQYGKSPTQDTSKWRHFSNITNGWINSQYYPNSANNSYYLIISPDKYAGLSSALFIDKGYDVAYAEGNKRAMYHCTKYNSNAFFMKQCDLLAIRESYRIKCDRMLNENDLSVLATSENIVTNHAIALSSWWVDLHETTHVNKDNITHSFLNYIPYECIIPSAFKNVLVACRAFGASHVALSACRLAKTMMSIGYGAGQAIKLASNTWEEDLRNVDIATLQSNIGINDLMIEIETYILNTTTTTE